MFSRHTVNTEAIHLAGNCEKHRQANKDRVKGRGIFSKALQFSVVLWGETREEREPKGDGSDLECESDKEAVQRDLEKKT